MQSYRTSSVVASVLQQSRQRVPDRVQRTPEGHMSSDGTTAGRADDQRRSVDDVSVPSRRPEHYRDGEQVKPQQLLTNFPV